MRKLYLLSATILLSGCANNFATNYTSFSNTNNPLYVASNDPIEIIITESPSPILKSYLKKGYVPIGQSIFQANGLQSKTDLKKQAIAVGAQVAIASRQDLGTRTFTMPLTTPTTSTSFSNSNYNVYGSRGSANVQGTTATTSYGTQTNYVPVSINSGKYTAVYLAKFKILTGIVPSELSDAEKKLRESNSGIKVAVVVDDSPAYYQDVLEGDIVVKVNDNNIFGVNGFVDAINKSNQDTVKLVISRNGATLTKQLKLNN